MATALDMVVVTVAIYIEPQALDAYLFYVPVMLGVALRYGLAASIWASVVMAFMYASVVFLATSVGDPARELLPIRIGYLIGLGAAAGLFARVAIDRATENAQLQQRLVEEERESLRSRETELLSQLAREFGTSLERKETTQAIARATAPLLGDVTWLLLAERADPADPGSLRLVPGRGRRHRRRAGRAAAHPPRRAQPAHRRRSGGRRRRNRHPDPRPGPAHLRGRGP